MEAITLLGRRDVDGTWQFRVAKNEKALLALLDEEADGAPEIKEPMKGPHWDSWDNALVQLNRYPWPRLYPLQVHAEFADRVLDVVAMHEHGGPDRVARWREVVRKGTV